MVFCCLFYVLTTMQTFTPMPDKIFKKPVDFASRFFQ